MPYTVEKRRREEKITSQIVNEFIHVYDDGAFIFGIKTSRIPKFFEELESLEWPEQSFEFELDVVAEYHVKSIEVEFYEHGLHDDLYGVHMGDELGGNEPIFFFKDELQLLLNPMD